MTEPRTCPTCGSDRKEMHWCAAPNHAKLPHHYVRHECVRCSAAWHDAAPPAPTEHVYVVLDEFQSGPVAAPPAQPAAEDLLNEIAADLRSVARYAGSDLERDTWLAAAEHVEEFVPAWHDAASPAPTASDRPGMMAYGKTKEEAVANTETLLAEGRQPSSPTP